MRIEYAQTTSTTGAIVAFRRNFSTLPEELRAPNAELSAIGVDFEESKLDIGLPTNFDLLGPKARIVSLQEAAPDSQQLLRFLSTGSQTSIQQQVRLSLPSAAAVVSCYLSFCSLLSIEPFPPNATVVQQWSTLFGHGRTYQIYVGHLLMACQLLQIDASWRDEGANAIM